MIRKLTRGKLIFFIAALFLVSCNKVNIKNIVIEEKLSAKSLKSITEIKLDGVPDSEHLLFGGDYFTYKQEVVENQEVQNFSIKHPYPLYVSAKNSIFLRANYEYSNEFYVVRKKLKKNFECVVETEDKDQTKKTFQQGEYITFVWSSSAGAKGWYQYFIEKNAIDKLEVDEKMFIMRVSTNKTKMTVTDTDNVTSLSTTIRVDENGNIQDLGINNPVPKAMVFEPKQRVGICSAFKFPGTSKMHEVTFSNTLNIKGKANEYILNSNF